MKLEIKTKADFYNGRITAQLEKKQTNPALKNMLLKLQKGGLNALRNDDELRTFANGLIDSFKRDGYIADEQTSEKNPLSKLGNEIANTGKNFEQLAALFDISFVKSKNNLYLLECDVAPKDANEKNIDFKNEKIDGRFEEDIYRTEGEFEVRKLKLENENFLLRSGGRSNCDVTATYDFLERNVKNIINSKGEKYTFTTTDNNKFHFLNSESATQFLKDLFNIGVFKKCFAVNEDNSIVVERFENEMPFNLWEQIWDKGEAELTMNDEKETKNFHFSGIRFSIDDKSICAEALKHYLMFKAETAYIGKNETGNLINTFDKLFISCPNIKESTSSLYEQTKETALRENKIKALLRMQAYQDLSPDEIYKDYEKRTPITYSNRDISFAEFVSDVFGGDRNILSVVMFSKYLSENISACRAALIIAENVEQKFGVKMNIITSSETKKSSQQKIENIFFKKIEQAANVIDEKFADIKDIHDRYWQIERDGGKTEFFIISGELDALKFENDFTNSKPRRDITAETKGTVKEMTVTFVDESGLPEKIKKYFEQTLTKGEVK